MFSLTQLVVLASAFTATYAQIFGPAPGPGTYGISTLQTGEFAQNLPGGQAPNLNAITFSGLAPNGNNFASWVIENAPGGDGFTITNAGSGSKAYSPIEVSGALVEGFTDTATSYAIESAGADTWVIKATNSDLLWTVATNNAGQALPFLRPASGGDNQKFVLVPV